MGIERNELVLYDIFLSFKGVENSLIPVVMSSILLLLRQEFNFWTINRTTHQDFFISKQQQRQQLYTMANYYQRFHDMSDRGRVFKVDISGQDLKLDV